MPKEVTHSLTYTLLAFLSSLCQRQTGACHWHLHPHLQGLNHVLLQPLTSDTPRKRVQGGEQTQGILCSGKSWQRSSESEIFLGADFMSPVLVSPHICCCCLVTKPCPTLYATPWTAAHQAPLSMGFPRQEPWSGCYFLLQGIFLTQVSP